MSREINIIDMKCDRCGIFIQIDRNTTQFATWSVATLTLNEIGNKRPQPPKPLDLCTGCTEDLQDFLAGCWLAKNVEPEPDIDINDPDAVEAYVQERVENIRRGVRRSAGKFSLKSDDDAVDVNIADRDG